MLTSIGDYPLLYQTDIELLYTQMSSDTGIEYNSDSFAPEIDWIFLVNLMGGDSKGLVINSAVFQDEIGIIVNEIGLYIEALSDFEKGLITFLFFTALLTVSRRESEGYYDRLKGLN